MRFINVIGHRLQQCGHRAASRNGSRRTAGEEKVFTVCGAHSAKNSEEKWESACGHSWGSGYSRGWGWGGGAGCEATRKAVGTAGRPTLLTWVDAHLTPSCTRPCVLYICVTFNNKKFKLRIAIGIISMIIIRTVDFSFQKYGFPSPVY